MALRISFSIPARASRVAVAAPRLQHPATSNRLNRSLSILASPFSLRQRAGVTNVNCGSESPGNQDSRLSFARSVCFASSRTSRKRAFGWPERPGLDSPAAQALGCGVPTACCRGPTGRYRLSRPVGPWCFRLLSNVPQGLHRWAFKFVPFGLPGIPRRSVFFQGHMKHLLLLGLDCIRLVPRWLMIPARHLVLIKESLSVQ